MRARRAQSTTGSRRSRRKEPSPSTKRRNCASSTAYRARAATLAARGGTTGKELRLACAQLGDQITIFGEALQELASRSAHPYRDEDRFWFSPQPTLRKLATDRAQDVNEEQADSRIIELLKEE